MKIELKVISNIYSDPDKNGNRKIIKKNVISRINIHNRASIVYHEEVLNRKGNIIKKECFIRMEGETFRVKHSYEELDSLLGNSNKHVGFSK